MIEITDRHLLGVLIGLVISLVIAVVGTAGIMYGFFRRMNKK